MSFIPRAIQAHFLKSMLPNKVLLLLGARRCGKTSFIKDIFKDWKEPVLFLNGEDSATLEVLKNRSVENYKSLLGKHKFLVIDEAQKIPGIGMILKLMVDEIPDIRIIATGSSQFDLQRQLGEPLTGRKITFQLYPLAQMEYAEHENLVQTRARLEERLIYGSYPELLQYESKQDKATYLKELVNSYLLKDILEYDGIRNSAKMLDLLRLVAFQTGQEVSLDELGRQLGMTKNTVDKYLDLLSKVFVIYRLQGYSRNLRKEVSKSSKWYFYDNGIRNTLIANFYPLTLRNDTGQLWENYLLSERIKYQHYTGMIVHNFFWRTYEQQEIDWIEERDGTVHAYEIKWNPTRKTKVPGSWKTAYPGSTFQVVNPDNYLEWIS